jgi:hypothetical protein
VQLVIVEKVDAEGCGIRQPRSKTMIYMMTKPCPICKQQLTKQKPTETVPCICGQHVWQG